MTTEHKPHSTQEARELVKRLRYERSLPVQSQFVREDVLKCCNVIDGLIEQLEAAQERLAAYEEPGWINPVQKVLELQEQLEAVQREAQTQKSMVNGYRIRADAAEEQLETYERFEDDVRDVMDFIPKDKHYDALNDALGRIRASNPAKERPDA